MKKIRRFNIITVFICLLALAFTFSVNVNAANKVFENIGATYEVKEVKDKVELGYGVHYHRDWSANTIKDPKYCTSSVAGSDGGGYVEVGKEYTNQVNVLEIDPSMDVELVPYANLSGQSWNTSTVRNAAKTYEERHHGQKVIAAINGDFFHISDNVKASTGVTIGQGEFYKTVASHGHHQNIAIKNNGSGKQFETVTITPDKTRPFLTIYDEKGAEIKKFEINKVNKEPGNNEISLFYAQRETNWGPKVLDQQASNVWFVDLTKDSVAVTAVQDSFYGKGEITEYIAGDVRFGAGKFAIKSNNPEVDKYLKKGVTIRCQYELIGDLKDVKAAIGFPFKILENNELVSNDSNRHPRTVIGQKEDGTMVLTVIDGRQKSKGMYGATSAEMGAIMGYYGCVDAWNLDGGGSSTMLVRKQAGWDFKDAYKADKYKDSSWYVTNSPSDGNERFDGNCLLIVVKVPDSDLSIKSITNNTVVINVALLTDIERYKELYIKINDKFYKVENGIIKVDGLNAHGDYIGFLYAKVNGEMRNLMSEIPFTTCFDYPTDVSITVTQEVKKGKNLILVKFNTSSRDGIQNIYFTVGDKRYGTINEFIYVDESYDFYKTLANLQLNIIFKGTNIAQDELLEFKNVEVKCDSTFILNEIDYRINDRIKDIFDMN